MKIDATLSCTCCNESSVKMEQLTSVASIVGHAEARVRI